MTRARDGRRWRARYRDSRGREHERLFDRWEDARDWRSEQLAAVASGSWVNPADGRTTLRAYAERWLDGAGLRSQSRETVSSRLRLHVYPVLGDRPLAELRHSELRAWLSGLEQTLAPWTVYGVHSVTRTILNSAVADRILARSPFERIPLENVKRRAAVVPYTVEQVRAVLEAASGQYRPLFALAAGTGMRGGELLGLDLADVDFLRRTVRVRRQLVWVRPGEDVPLRPAWGPPKTATSYRTLDVPAWAMDEVSAHLAVRPAVGLTLPVVDVPGESQRSGRLVFTTSNGRPIRRNGLASSWATAVRRAGLPDVRGEGPHALRHHVASLLIDAGESVKAVQAQLGHATAAETWDTYGHLFPDQGARARRVLERAWQADAGTATSADAGQMRADDA